MTKQNLQQAPDSRRKAGLTFSRVQQPFLNRKTSQFLKKAANEPGPFKINHSRFYRPHRCSGFKNK